MSSPAAPPTRERVDTFTRQLLPRSTSYLDVFNAYSRRNSIGYRYTVTVHGSDLAQVARENDHDLFPILPSVGAVWDF